MFNCTTKAKSKVKISASMSTFFALPKQKQNNEINWRRGDEAEEAF